MASGWRLLATGLAGLAASLLVSNSLLTQSASGGRDATLEAIPVAVVQCAVVACNRESPSPPSPAPAVALAGVLAATEVALVATRVLRRDRSRAAVLPPGAPTTLLHPPQLRLFP